MDNLFKPKNIPFQKLEEFVQVNFDEYESPISVYLNEQYRPHKQMVNDIVEATVFEEVLSVGVDVDKGELLKALAYDRNQYGEGYAAGIKAAAPKWISVDERLPEDPLDGSGEVVELLIEKHGTVLEVLPGYYDHHAKDWLVYLGDPTGEYLRDLPGWLDVIKWRQMPEPPKEE